MIRRHRTSLPCRHRWSIGLRCGLRLGNHSNSTFNAEAFASDAAAVWLESSSNNRTTCAVLVPKRRTLLHKGSEVFPAPHAYAPAATDAYVSRLIAPNSTRLALPPVIGTGAGCPAQRPAGARRGGNISCRSVSSSASLALRGGKACKRRRMAAFSPALGQAAARNGTVSTRSPTLWSRRRIVSSDSCRPVRLSKHSRSSGTVQFMPM